MTELRCPLCGESALTALGRVHGRDFHDCDSCGLAFVDPFQRLSAEDERARYATHRNDPGDAGYRAFLARVADPLLARVAPDAEGLDYGSGPGPTLSRMLSEAGRPTRDYDPYFAPDATALARTYDFVTCTETAEHFFEPAAEFARLAELLKPGGWLGLMTTMREEAQPFADWWYARDPTHVCFYRWRTMEWIAARHGWSLERPHPNVALFRNHFS
ncbi:MAG TPA: class I SAM-dependent methyltransferase [Longimicrobiales bacterium]